MNEGVLNVEYQDVHVQIDFLLEVTQVRNSEPGVA